MTAIYFDSTHSDAERRKNIYAGDIYVFSPNEATLGLCQLAKRLCEEAFSPHPPPSAQQHFEVADYAAILAQLKPEFIHHPEAKEWIKKIFMEFGCDLERSYFDVPRLRTSTSGGYLTSGMAYAFHPHRDTWYSAPTCQINCWMPVYAAEAGNVMAFHSKYFDQAVANTSSGYDYYRWNATNRRAAATQIGKDTREQPHATESLELEPDLRIVAPVGGLMMFSGAQLHSSVENDSGNTRISIDFRVLDIDDATARRGVSMHDFECTGTTLRDYMRASDLARMPEEVALLHDSGDGREEGELVYDPDA